jgi:hypothetical protein
VDAELASAERAETAETAGRVSGPRAGLARVARWPGLSPLLALLPSLWLALPLLWTTPLSSDHATHLFKAWHFWFEMLGRGRLRGWSHFWAFGSPTGELVPFGGELWVALFRAATFGQLSWMRTYSLAFAGVLIFKAVAVYVLASTFFGRRAAVVCAWIAAFDPGGGLEGGWEWHTYWGVWPVTLAMSAFSLGLVRLERALALGRSRDVLWAGAWLAAALLTHPIVLLAIVIVTPALLLDHLARPERLSLARFLGALGAVALGFALSAFFLVPFFARSQHTQDLGWLGESLPVVSQKLVELRTFQHVWVPVHGLALLGGWLAWRRRLPGAVFFVGAGALLVFLASGVLLRDFHLERVLPSLIKIEANRFLLVAKLFWFPLAGYGATQLVAPLLGSQPAATRTARVVRWAVGVALGLALIAPGYRAFYKEQLARGYVGESKRKYWADFPAMLRRTEELAHDSTEHFRIAYEMWRGDHLSTLAPVFNGALMYKVGYTPAQIYDKLPMTDEHDLLQKLSVKYIVSESALDRPDVTEMERFGGLWLYRFDDYRPEPFTLLGAGRAELIELSPERVRVRLQGTDADSRLVLHVASYDRWRATLGGGDELPIATVPALGVEYPMLMEVPARDGELVFDYVYRGADWAGLLVSLFALPAFAGIRRLGRRRGLVERLAESLRRRQRALGWGALAGALLLVGLVAARARSRERLLPPSSIFHRLEAGGSMTLGDQPCVLEAPLAFRCGPHRVQADVSEGVWGLHLCMTAPDAGDLRVRVRTQLGSFLAGHYDAREEGEGSIVVRVDGEALASIATRPAFLRHQRIQLDTRSRRQQTADVEVVLTGKARNCFDLQTVD